MRRTRWWALAVLLVVAGTVGGLLWLHAALYRDHFTGDTVRVRVASGSSLTEVAEKLEGRGLLQSSWRLRAVARLEGGAERIQAGEYDLPRGASPATLLRYFVEGRQRLRQVTLVEGLRRELSVTVLADSLELDPGTLDTLVTRPLPRWRELLSLQEGRTLEGYLFPETYRFAADTPARDVVEALVRSFLEHIDSPMEQRRREIGWTLHEVVTLASIVEAEAVFDQERSRPGLDPGGALAGAGLRRHVLRG